MKAIRTILACIRKVDQKYNLINHGDKIVIGLSGGKDSLALTYALTLYQKFSHTDFVIQPVTLDLGFDGFDPKPLQEFCSSLNLNLIVHDARDVYKILELNKDDDKHLPCSICSKMKKAAINKVAKDLGFNKVAFAHHADDAIETLFMNEIYGGRIATFSPKMHLERADITFIRPLLYVREIEIEKFIKEENVKIVKSHCPADKHTSREEIKNLLKDIYKKYDTSKESFLKMLDNYEKEDTWGKEIEYQINQNGLILKPAITINDYVKVRYIRSEVFIKEKGISIDDEINDGREEFAKHFLIILKGLPIGTIRYRNTAEGYEIERFAVLKEYRNKGYGKQAIHYLIEMIGSNYNPCKIFLHAMYHLKDFYISVGFTPVGDPFMEAGIKHIKMELYK